MGATVSVLRLAADAPLLLLDYLSPFAALTVLSVVTGVLMLYVIKYTTWQHPLERARDRVAASLYELRLFLDSPRRVFSALGRLLGGTAVYTGLLLPALVVMSIPMALLYGHMQTRFGFEPLSLRTPVVMQIELAKGADPHGVRVQSSQGVSVTAPLLVDVTGQSVFVRLELQSAGSHKVRIAYPGGDVEKRLDGMGGFRPVSPERVRGWGILTSYTHEPILPDGPITGIRVSYPDDKRTWLWLPWWGYWLLAATVVAFALRRRLGIVF